jgi:peroxidase
LSNAFFAKTTEDTDYEHTPILVGLIEFVIHDIAFSMSSRELIETPVPKCDTAFDPQCTGNKTMKAWRSAAMEGTGTDSSNPRETKNGVTSWLDLSALYGSNPEIAKKLRTLKNGKLLTQKGPDGKDYPPYNTFGVPILGHRPGVDPTKLFAFGDPRGNQDWLIIAVETLLLREHNRLCDIIQSQFPVWDDETVYQFARHALSVKYQMIANLYQQAYFTEEMPRPHIDGVPLFRQWHAKNALQMNAVTHFPFWPGLVNGKPVTTSQEMAIGYRFHEILPTNVPLVNETGQVNGTYNVVKTAFDSEGFIKAGLENVLRGMAAVQIPNFHTGTSDEYRNMVFNFGDPSENVFYDLVAKTITHERERGLPAFNDYFRAYTGKPQVRIRKTFEDFTTNPVYLKALKELYNHPDEVDLTVGQYLDEDYFPGTTVPRSQLITSLFSLFGLGVSDRFSPGYISVKCLPFFGTQTPFTCTPTNALEYLLWKPTTFLGFKVHWYDAFWARELSIDDYGTSSLWRLVTENSDVKCLQKNPLFPMDPVTNPVVCSYEEFYPGTWLATFIKGGFFAFIIITSILCVRPSFRPQQEE